MEIVVLDSWSSQTTLNVPRQVLIFPQCQGVRARPRARACSGRPHVCKDSSLLLLRNQHLMHPKFTDLSRPPESLRPGGGGGGGGGLKGGPFLSGPQPFLKLTQDPRLRSPQHGFQVPGRGRGKGRKENAAYLSPPKPLQARGARGGQAERARARGRRPNAGGGSSETSSSPEQPSAREGEADAPGSQTHTTHALRSGSLRQERGESHGLPNLPGASGQAATSPPLACWSPWTLTTGKSPDWESGLMSERWRVPSGQRKIGFHKHGGIWFQSRSHALRKWITWRSRQHRGWGGFAHWGLFQA
ncbi:uncharacterized protein LOC114046227 [Vombatus ursinus]|uniref:uncharacterized protein LOC114046227 n=1 Tax=Vombatus ursinus TaxID=29139 RepID=UPI000FFD3303|nr:uncharacterized protein LOC114046227 [Vombatus ursinus]